MTSPSNKPAFPTVGAGIGDYTGMTLRDYFAAKALQALVPMPFADTIDNAPEFLSKTAYGIADAMLKARDGQP